MLSENDLKVLKAISEGGSDPKSIDPKSIADKLNMKVEAVRASADALGEQGLISVDKSVEESVSLTEEGKKYAEEGLPERALLSFIGSGKAMSELKDPAHKIGLGWMRKKGWAVIDKGMVSPTGSAPKGEDEEILEKLLAGPKSSSKLDKIGLDLLRSRGLVKLSIQKYWNY
ncbi:MAG: phenylalanine--tRNA ligase subunit alpha, partial [Methanothrix sp.]|nr:phenylalanine--tRNA ligase subunit alpha [Methanothrix sp.]